MMSLADILFNPVMPWWIVLPCGIVFAWLAWMTYSRCKLTFPEKATLWGLRILAFLLISWIMLQPSLRNTRNETEKPAVAIVTDMSASMEDNPLGVAATRAARAADFLESKAIKKVASEARVYYFGAGEDLKENWRPGDFLSPKTLLSPALNKLAARFRGDNLAAVIVLTDGLDQSPLEFDASLLRAPVFVPELEEPGTPSAQTKLDFSVGALSYPKRTIAGWKTAVGVTINRTAGTAAASFPVKILKDGNVIQEEKLDFSEKENMKRASFTVEPMEIGSAVYAVVIEPETDDDSGNNRKELLIEVTDSKQRILYLEGTPRWEFKFLKRALLAEKNLQLSAYVRSGNGAFINFDELGEGGELPKLDAESLRQYKAVVLGNLQANALTSAEAAQLTKFVENGGGILFIGGVDAYKNDGIASIKELRPVMPAASEAGASMREGRFVADFTPEGRVLPSFSALASEVRFPPLLTIWGPVKATEFTSTYLAAADGSPVLLARRAGQGRAAMLLSDSLWRWQMGGGTEEGGKGLYGRFITQLLHWLCPSQRENDGEEALQALVAESEVEQNQNVFVGAIGVGKENGAGVTCTVTAPSGKTMSIPMLPAKLEADVGLTHSMDGFRCAFSPAETGTYKIELTTSDGARRASTVILSRYPEHEHTGAIINRAYLRRLAEKSHGKCVTWYMRDTLLEDLKLEPRTVETVEERPIWNWWFVLAVLMALFCLEWWLRRKWELV